MNLSEELNIKIRERHFINIEMHAQMEIEFLQKRELELLERNERESEKLIQQSRTIIERHYGNSKYHSK